MYKRCAVLLSMKKRALAIIPTFLLTIVINGLVNLGVLSMKTPKYLTFSFSSISLLCNFTTNLKSEERDAWCRVQVLVTLREREFVLNQSLTCNNVEVIVSCNSHISFFKWLPYYQHMINMSYWGLVWESHWCIWGTELVLGLNLGERPW